MGSVLIVTLAGCGNPSAPSGAAPGKAQTTSPAVGYGAGDGSSLEQAIAINGAKGEEDGVAAEYSWLRRHYPGYRLLRQAVKNVGGRVYDQMDIATPGGHEQSVFFEITAFYGK